MQPGSRRPDRKPSAVYESFWLINVLIRYIRLDKPETANKLVSLFRGLWFMGHDCTKWVSWVSWPKIAATFLGTKCQALGKKLQRKYSKKLRNPMERNGVWKTLNGLAENIFPHFISRVTRQHLSELWSFLRSTLIAIRKSFTTLCPAINP